MQEVKCTVLYPEQDSPFILVKEMTREGFKVFNFGVIHEGQPTQETATKIKNKLLFLFKEHWISKFILTDLQDIVLYDVDSGAENGVLFSCSIATAFNQSDLVAQFPECISSPTTGYPMYDESKF